MSNPIDVLEVIRRFDAANHTTLCAYPTTSECEAAYAAIAQLIEHRRILFAALQEAHYCGLMIGADCAWALAKLQREGVYKPVCSDGGPSRADASRDLEEIKVCLEKSKAALARCEGTK